MDSSLSFRRALVGRLLPLLHAAGSLAEGALAEHDSPPPSGPRSGSASGTWRAVESDAACELRPDVADLAPAQRTALAEVWLHEGLAEHTSVASFGRLALELLAAGAPAALVADAHRAALDEVRHAKLSLGLASVYAGQTLAPGPFDFGRSVAIDADLAAIAVRTLLEGCAGETFRAVLAQEQLALASDDAVRAVLALLVSDEARHAELAFRTVAWTVQAGGPRVREALRNALHHLLVPALPAADAPTDPELAAHGKISSAAARTAMERALTEVILPCLRALCGDTTHADHRFFPADERACA